MTKYTFQAPVQIGDHVYVIVYDDGETIIDELTVTEVASRGIFVSSYDPPEDGICPTQTRARAGFWTNRRLRTPQNKSGG